MSAALSLGRFDGIVADRLAEWDAVEFIGRLTAKDHTLWSEDLQPEIVDRLGWLTLPETMQEEVAAFAEFAEEVRGEGTRHVVLLGMGGSSLAPEVFQRTFGNAPGYPELIVLDSTHPAAVTAVAATIDPATTVFIVASKSGTTLEPLSFFRYFWERARGDGDRFAAITDPGSSLGDLAAGCGFRRVFEATPDVGGRYSALTAFGLVPAALIGVDVPTLLDRAGGLADGLALGAALGELARAGRDKATFLVSESLAAFPDWVEQLIAESTGKNGTGILPVAGESAGPPEVYGADRFFVYLAHSGDDDRNQAAQVDALEAAGHPVARIETDDLHDLAREMFRFEVATAAAGAVLGIHPFNQPDVQIAKELARRAMAGELDVGDVVEVDAHDATALARAAQEWLGSHTPGDYVSIQAYLPAAGAAAGELRELQTDLRNRLRAASTLGFGPRFLHSTGQFHKGGPNTGMFLQIVDTPSEPVPVPETDFSFARLVAGQALGDYHALRSRDRRVLRVNVGGDVLAGLLAVDEAMRG